MIFCQMVVNSPSSRERTPDTTSTSNVLHLTARQLTQTRIHNDDIRYHKLLLTRVVLLGQLMSAEKETSQRGMAMISVRIQDSTGSFVVKMIDREHTARICENRGVYVKIAASIKCGGLVYRPEVKLMGSSMSLVVNFNEVTEHLLECMRTAIMS